MSSWWIGLSRSEFERQAKEEAARIRQSKFGYWLDYLPLNPNRDRGEPKRLSRQQVRFPKETVEGEEDNE